MKTFKLFFGLASFMLFSFGVSAQNLDTDGDGKVGVGTSNPESTFHIQKGGIGGLTFHNSNNLWSYIGNNYSKMTGKRISDGAANQIIFSPDGYVRFRTAVSGNGNTNISSWKDQMTLWGDGKIFIGNQNTLRLDQNGNEINVSDYRLFVDNGILTEKVKVASVDSEHWADYVFEPDYDLNAIEEVESFVKTNKHLPNVPSAKEVEANGVDMVEMDATLLRQVEELWLHTIDLNKDKETLEQENETLIKEVATLQTQNEELTEQVDDLSKQFEVLFNKVRALEIQP